MCWLLVLRPIVSRGTWPMGRVPSVEVFLRDPSPYLREFRRKLAAGKIHALTISHDFWRNNSIFMQNKITHLENISREKSSYFGSQQKILPIFGNSLFMSRKRKKNHTFKKKYPHGKFIFQQLFAKFADFSWGKSFFSSVSLKFC